MKKLFTFLLLTFALNSFAGDTLISDTTHIYKKIDTTYIEDYRDLLNGKFIVVVRTNKFSIKDNISQSVLEYSINTNANLGIGFSFRKISFEFQFNPHGLNNDDNLYGKSEQFSFGASSNGRKLIYNAYFRYNQGYHTTARYKVSKDTSFTYAHLYRPDIENTSIGGEFIYLFNHQRFSSSAPYSLTQRQKKRAGSFLLGGFFSLYAITADSLIFPDSLKSHFTEEVQFKSASSSTLGVAFGYTYTFLFKKNWFLNLYLLPGLAFQQYNSTNALNEQSHANGAIGGSLQTRFSLGFNRPRYFLGISWMNTQHFIDNDKKSSLSYKYGSFRFYCGYRFDLKKVIKRLNYKT